jgi:putative membrane protein
MNRRFILCACRNLALAAPALGLGLRATSAFAANDAVSAADRTFIMKVSQGGMYEVEASKVATDKAHAQDVIDQSITEVHDHQLVGDKLKSIASSLNIDFPSSLNPAFQARLDHLKTLSGTAFDDAYIKEMNDIHAKDVVSFADEAKNGTNSQLRAFAAETVIIVRRHIGALHAVPLPTN